MATPVHTVTQLSMRPASHMLLDYMLLFFAIHMATGALPFTWQQARCHSHGIWRIHIDSSK